MVFVESADGRDGGARAVELRGALRAAGRGMARSDGRVFPERGLDPRQPRAVRRASSLQDRERPSDVGCRARTIVRAGARPNGESDSSRPSPSRMRCFTRATFSSRTPRRRRRIVLRWQFGVVVPQAYAANGTGEPAEAQTEILSKRAERPAVDVQVRFLQVEARWVRGAIGSIVRAGRFAGSRRPASRHVRRRHRTRGRRTSDREASCATAAPIAFGAEERDRAAAGGRRHAARADRPPALALTRRDRASTARMWRTGRRCASYAFASRIVLRSCRASAARRCARRSSRRTRCCTPRAAVSLRARPARRGRRRNGSC